MGGDWPWPSMSNLTSKSKFTPFWACPCDNSSPVQARATKFGPEVLNTLVKIPVVLGVDWAWHVMFNLFSKSCLFASLLHLWNICETCKKRMKWSLFHILNGYAHICSTTETCHGPWNSRVVSLVWPLLASQSSTQRLAMDSCMLLKAFDKSYIPHMLKFCMPTFDNGRNNSKTACICLYRVSISKIGLSRFVYVGAIFSAVTTCRGFHLTVIAWRRSWHCCI